MFSFFKVREKSGILLNADFHENLLLLSIIENVCHGIHQYESARVNFLEFVIVYCVCNRLLCYISNIKYNTDIHVIWNELFQTLGFV